ncbi:major capsid protein P2 [Neptunicella sp. SCSIO 80796]|uniref:major capsid protein P2 n=1 Tax=Neptunicella plasticusilytica TaxID=3117012 RepID=UPI003A4DE841
MSRKFNLLPSFSNVSAGGIATLEIPVGVTYDRIMVEYAGVTLSQIQNIEVLVNGKPIWQIADGQRLHDLNSFYKERNATAGVLDFWFIRPEFDNIDMRRLTALGTMDVATFAIKMKIDNAAAAPVLTATAVKSLNSPLGMITKIKSFPASSATAGLKDIDNIPKEGRLAAVHFFKDDISKVDVEADSVKVYELSKSLGEKVQADYDRVPMTAKATTVDFVTEGNPATGLIIEGVQHLTFRPTLDTSGAFDVVVEYLTGFKGI